MDYTKIHKNYIEIISKFGSFQVRIHRSQLNLEITSAISATPWLHIKRFINFFEFNILALISFDLAWLYMFNMKKKKNNAEELF